MSRGDKIIKIEKKHRAASSSHRYLASVYSASSGWGSRAASSDSRSDCSDRADERQMFSELTPGQGPTLLATESLAAALAATPR